MKSTAHTSIRILHSETNTLLDGRADINAQSSEVSIALLRTGVRIIAIVAFHKAYYARLKAVLATNTGIRILFANSIHKYLNRLKIPHHSNIRVLPKYYSNSTCNVTCSCQGAIIRVFHPFFWSTTVILSSILPSISSSISSVNSLVSLISLLDPSVSSIPLPK